MIFDDLIKISLINHFQLSCGSNDAINEWKVYPGCRTPTCDAKLEIVDAWKTGGRFGQKIDFIV